MSKKKSVFREEDFIPGIFNYCNSWCERCAFRLRCRNYAMAADEDGNPIDPHAEGGTEKIEENMRKAMDLLGNWAEDHDIDPEEFEQPDPEEMKEWQEEHDRELEDANEHPLGRHSLAYSDMAREWLDEHEDLIDRKVRRLQADKETHNDGARLANASEVAHWYVFMIHVKSHRALMGIADMHEDHWGTPVQSDANGSAKVVLLGAEESLSAWVVMTDLMPEVLDELMPILAQLQRVLVSLNSSFPDALKFKRAGFDDGI